MKIAIVTGGFDGIRRQKRIWDLEREIENQARILHERAAGTQKARSRLTNLQNDLLASGPSKEIKEAK